MRARVPRILTVAALATVAFALEGCKGCGGDGGGSGASPSASTSASAAPSAATTPQRRAPMVRLAGPGGQLFRAATQLELREDQKTAIEKINADLGEARLAAADAGARTETKEAHDDLVAGIKAGKVDMAKIAAHGPALEKAAAARHDKDDEAIQRLHDILDASQRATIVGNVRKQEEKREARIKAHEKPDAGQVNFARARMESYTRDLDLDAEQQKKVQAILPTADSKGVGDVREEAKKELAALLTAFEKDVFDAKALGDVHKAKNSFEELAAFMAKLTPILKPEQREKLAKKLERSERPRRGGYGGGATDDDLDP